MSESRYSRPKLIVLGILVVAFFVFNYVSLTYIAQQGEIKDKIAELVVYQFKPNTLRDAPFVGESLREGLVGGLAINNVDGILIDESKRARIKQLIKDAQQLSTASSQLPVFMAYDYAAIGDSYRDKSLLVDHVAKLKATGFNVLLLPYRIDSEASNPFAFVAAKRSESSTKNIPLSFQNKDNLKLTYIYHSSKVEDDIIAAFNTSTDMIYVNQANGEKQYRIFQIVNIVYQAIQDKKLDRAKIEASYNKVHALRSQLK